MKKRTKLLQSLLFSLNIFTLLACASSFVFVNHFNVLNNSKKEIEIKASKREWKPYANFKVQIKNSKKVGGFTPELIDRDINGVLASEGELIRNYIKNNSDYFFSKNPFGAGSSSGVFLDYSNGKGIIHADDFFHVWSSDFIVRSGMNVSETFELHFFHVGTNRITTRVNNSIKDWFMNGYKDQKASEISQDAVYNELKANLYKIFNKENIGIDENIGPNHPSSTLVPTNPKYNDIYFDLDRDLKKENIVLEPNDNSGKLRILFKLDKLYHDGNYISGTNDLPLFVIELSGFLVSGDQTIVEKIIDISKEIKKNVTEITHSELQLWAKRNYSKFITNLPGAFDPFRDLIIEEWPSLTIENKKSGTIKTNLVLVNYFDENNLVSLNRKTFEVTFIGFEKIEPSTITNLSVKDNPNFNIIPPTLISDGEVSTLIHENKQSIFINFPRKYNIIDLKVIEKNIDKGEIVVAAKTDKYFDNKYNEVEDPKKIWTIKITGFSTQKITTFLSRNTIQLEKYNIVASTIAWEDPTDPIVMEIIEELKNSIEKAYGVVENEDISIIQPRPNDKLGEVKLKLQLNNSKYLKDSVRIPSKIFDELITITGFRILDTNLNTKLKNSYTNIVRGSTTFKNIFGKDDTGFIVDWNQELDRKENDLKTFLNNNIRDCFDGIGNDSSVVKVTSVSILDKNQEDEIVDESIRIEITFTGYVNGDINQNLKTIINIINLRKNPDLSRDPRIISAIRGIVMNTTLPENQDEISNNFLKQLESKIKGSIADELNNKVKDGELPKIIIPSDNTFKAENIIGNIGIKSNKIVSLSNTKIQKQLSNGKSIIFLLPTGDFNSKVIASNNDYDQILKLMWIIGPILGFVLIVLIILVILYFIKQKKADAMIGSSNF